MSHPTLSYDPVANRITSKMPIFINDKKHLSSYFHEAQRLSDSIKATRITIRIIIPKSFYDPAIRFFATNKYKTEAAMPLKDDFADYMLVYAGYNCSDRVSSENILSEQEKLLSQVLANNKLSSIEIEQILHERPYRVEYLEDKIETADRNTILRIHKESLPVYQRHDFNRTLDIMLASPETYSIAVIRDLNDNRICVFCNTKHTSVVLGCEKTLRFAEFDNCVKSQSDDAPRGVAKHLKFSLAIEAFSRGANFCLSESRAANAGINGTNHRLGMKHYGLLEQHIVIAGPNDIDIDIDKEESYEDFNVWALGIDDLNGK